MFFGAWRENFAPLSQMANFQHFQTAAQTFGNFGTPQRLMLAGRAGSGHSTVSRAALSVSAVRGFWSIKHNPELGFIPNQE